METIGSALTGKGDRIMLDREKIKEGLKQCDTGTCVDCPFWDSAKNSDGCGLNVEALALIQELEEEIKQLEQSDGAFIVNHGTINFTGR